MKKWLKRLAWLAGIVVALIVVLLVCALIFINPIVKTSTETVGPMLTKAPVTLGASNISIFGGVLDLRDLNVGNPPGFDSDTSLAFRQIYVDIDVGSLLSDVIIIDSVVVDGLSVTIEQGLKNNLVTILDNVKAFAGEQEKKAQEKKPEGKEEVKGEGKKVIIRELAIVNGKVSMAITGVGGAPVPMFPLRLKNIGGNPDDPNAKGASYAEIFEDVLVAIIGSASNAGEALKNVGKSASEAVSKGADNVNDAAKKATESIKGLFN